MLHWILAAQVLVGPVVPGSETEVLLTLPSLAGPREKVALEELRKRLAADPRDAAAAAALAADLVADAEALGDARYRGRAEAVLAPWKDVADAPLDVLRVRAKLKPTPEDYAALVKAEESAIGATAASSPTLTEARTAYAAALVRAGRLQQATAVCQSLDGARAAVCNAEIAAFENRTADVAALLALHVLPEVTFEPALKARALWLSAAATKSEAQFHEAMAYAPNDRALKAAYLDFLLAERRHAEAGAFVAETERDVGLLVRAAIAAKRDGAVSRHKELTERLALVFMHERERGTAAYAAEEALFQKDALP